MINNHFYPLIRKALDRNGWQHIEVDQVVTSICDGRAEAWFSQSGRSMVVTYDSTDSNSKKICNAWLVCGALREAIFEVTPKIEQRKKDQVDIFRLEGFPGYQKLLSKIGYKTKRVVMEK